MRPDHGDGTLDAPAPGEPTSPAPPSLDKRRRLEEGVDRLVPASLRKYREQIHYLVVGGWNTLFGYACFALLYFLFGDLTPYFVIIVASYVLAIANAYLGYRYVVFRSHGTILLELPRFSLVYLVTMCVNLVFFPLALRVLPVSAYVVQALFTLGVVIASYFGHKYFSFGTRGQGEGKRLG